MKCINLSYIFHYYLDYLKSCLGNTLANSDGFPKGFSTSVGMFILLSAVPDLKTLGFLWDVDKGKNLTMIKSFVLIISCLFRANLLISNQTVIDNTTNI